MEQQPVDVKELKTAGPITYADRSIIFIERDEACHGATMRGKTAVASEFDATTRRPDGTQLRRENK